MIAPQPGYNTPLPSIVYGNSPPLPFHQFSIPSEIPVGFNRRPAPGDRVYVVEKTDDMFACVITVGKVYSVTVQAEDDSTYETVQWWPDGTPEEECYEQADMEDCFFWFDDALSYGNREVKAKIEEDNPDA